MHESPTVRRGRGALSNAAGRYEPLRRVDVDDGWRDAPVEEGSAILRTRWRDDRARGVIVGNDSPDLGFDRSVNPYRGCEHGCVYCYARPSHAWLGHSPGLDFERLLYAKRDAPRLLREELRRRGYPRRFGGVRPIALGVNTDAWQPLERELRITRGVLEVLLEARHPVRVITKSSLVERDLDLLGALAERRLVSATVTLTTLDGALARRLEPRATAPHRRLRTVATLAAAGVPVSVSLSPVIPALNEHEIESLVEAAAGAGARGAHAIVLRLPRELASLFEEWLEAHYPARRARVLKALRSMRGGALNDAGFGTRFTGTGPRAELLRRRLALACRRYGIASGAAVREVCALDTTRFRAPAAAPHATVAKGGEAVQAKGDTSAAASGRSPAVEARGGAPRERGGQLDLFGEGAPDVG